MWIVSLALRRPYTFIVLALLIALLGVFAILRTPTDIFPNIKIPVVATVWRYSGLSPDEMATRLVLGSERSTQVTVNNVEHTESQSLSGVGVVKYFFQPEHQRRTVLRADHRHGPDRFGLRASRYDGAIRPGLQCLDGSGPAARHVERRSVEAKVFDLGNNVLRTALATVPGPRCPGRTAACSGRFRSTSTRMPCAHRVCRATT